MSMPSSSADVDASARSSPEESCRSSSRRSSGRYPARYALILSLKVGGTSRRVNSARSSAARRERANAIDLAPSSTSLPRSQEDSESALRRAPDSSSTSGGVHHAQPLSPP